MAAPAPAAPMLTTKEVAQELRCGADSVLRAANRGDLQAVRHGRLVRLRRSALDRFLTRYTTGGDGVA